MITKEEWKQVEDALKIIGDYAKLQIDGYEIFLNLLRVTTYKNSIFVYINDELKGEWIINECEERRRFFRERTASCLNTEQKAALKKKSKKFQREFYENHNTKYAYHEPYWNSFPALKKHLMKNNERIELIELGV